MSENARVEKLLLRNSALLQERRPVESIWEELGAICFPRRGAVVQRGQSAGRQQTSDRAQIARNFDGTAMRSCQILAYGQSSRITPSGSRWFVLRPPSRLRGNAQAERYCARATEQLTGLIAKSNFYSRSNQCYHERGAFGLSALDIRGGPKDRGLNFRTRPVGTFSIAENDQDEVDTLFDEFYRTPAQLMEVYGEDGVVPDSVRTLVADPTKMNVPSERVLVAVYPRGRERDPRKADGRNKPIASCHIHVESKTLMLEAGYDSMPTAVSRWQTHPNSPYGWAPADYALPEALQANFQEEMLDVLAEVSAFPRILFPAGMKDEIDFNAMGLTSFDPAAGETAQPREWLTAGRYDIGKDRAADKRRNIEDAFFVDLFKAISRLDPKATATQISAIVSESREMFQPIHSNMIREFHVPVLQRSYAIGLLQGEIEMPPPAMIEQDALGAFIADPEIDFVSAFALTLESDNLANLNAIIATVAPMAASDPSWFLPFKPETIVGSLMRQKNLPDNFTRSEEEMAAIQQAQQQAAQMQQLQEGTQAVRNLGGVDETRKGLELVEGAA